MFPHVLQDFLGCLGACGYRGLGCHGEGVDEGLWVVLPYVHEQLMDELRHKGTRGVNAGNELRNDLQKG